MAHNAKISGLTDELIHSILKFDPAANRHAYKHAKEIASRGLRGHQYARISQFDVTASFIGLDEKFRVKNRDDLADALQTRLQKLEAIPSKFKPDFLSFLLQLSDRPLENTKLDTLDILQPQDPPQTLTWHEILQQDPYSDDDIWDDINYADDSSGDEVALHHQERLKKLPPPCIEKDDTYSPEACIVPDSPKRVEELEAMHIWKAVSNEKENQIDVTELQVIRETLFMLGGLQTSLYPLDMHNKMRLDPRYGLSHAMIKTVDHLLLDFASIGREIGYLRQWNKRPSTLPLVQTFKAAVRTRLTVYERSLAQLHKHYLDPDVPIAVSLMELHCKAESISAPLVCLAQIVREIEPQMLVNPFSHLEALFEHTVLAQLTLNTEIFHFLSSVFFDCFQTYLEPIRKWMEDGELGANDETFFVFQNHTSIEASSLWHDRYALRRNAQKKLQVPSFLQTAAKKVFNTGKSVILLRELGIEGLVTRSSEIEPRLTRGTICGPLEEVPLSPFPELFQSAFQQWMQCKYSQASFVLRRHIFDNCGLMRALLIMEMLYLGKDGALFENLANILFERRDAGRVGWNDRYMLTELAREVFSSVIPPAEAEKIVVRSSKVKGDAQTVKGLAAVSIDFALPWSIQNIIQRSSIPIYQQIYTFLLQVYRVKYLLQRNRPSYRSGGYHRATLKLFHRLTWFVDVIRSYLTETAIFFTTRDMNMAMKEAEDIDEMAHIHIRFMVKLQERALLSKDLKLIQHAVIETLDLGLSLASSIHEKQRFTTSKPKGASDSELDEEEQMDNDDDAFQSTRSSMSREKTLAKIDSEFTRLLHFVSAGLRSVGRAGAEPFWEQLAERLNWEGKKSRY